MSESSLRAAPEGTGRGQLLLLDFVQQGVERAIEDRGRIAIRDLAAEQILDMPKLVVGLLEIVNWTR